MIKFKTGKTYRMRSICDHNCIWDLEVLNRTDKTATVKIEGKIKRCKIYNNDDGEYIFPLGRFSMNPILRANKELKPKTRDIYIAENGIEKPFNGQPIRVKKEINFLTENKDTGVKYYEIENCHVKVCSISQSGETVWHTVCGMYNIKAPPHLPLASGLVLCISGENK